MTMKSKFEREFTELKKIEKKKILAYCRKQFKQECSITAYSYNSKPDSMGFVEVTVEICDEKMQERVGTVILQACMFNRQQSWCSNSYDLR